MALSLQTPFRLRLMDIARSRFSGRLKSHHDSSSKRVVSQLELPIERERYWDRNADKGGRSFYFFDFDDNVAFLSTVTYIFHKETNQELVLSSGEFAQMHRLVGQPGPLADYRIDFCDVKGTFRNFRDKDSGWLEKVAGRKQTFVEDLAKALAQPDLVWKGPSWNCFFHATLNQRPMSVITARGHHPKTIVSGIDVLVEGGYLPTRPNFLSVFPVTNRQIRHELGDVQETQSVASLKRAAIRASVEKAFDVYGFNQHHRFGMSDDDPHNVELISLEMRELKKIYPKNSFFVIETQGGHFVKWEVQDDKLEPTLCTTGGTNSQFEQLNLQF